MAKLIVIDGLDGCGKGTQLEKLHEHLSKTLDVSVIDFPNYKEASSTLVKMYLNGEISKNAYDVNAYAASSFYASDRYISYMQHWKEDYISDKTILSNRYTSSNILHQMIKLPKTEWDNFINWVTDYEFNKLGIPKPDYTIILRVPVDISQKLLTNRYAGDNSKKDIHEADVEYLNKCSTVIDYACEKLGWVCIDCAKDGVLLGIEEIHEKILSVLNFR